MPRPQHRDHASAVAAVRLRRRCYGPWRNCAVRERTTADAGGIEAEQRPRIEFVIPAVEIPAAETYRKDVRDQPVRLDLEAVDRRIAAEQCALRSAKNFHRLDVKNVEVGAVQHSKHDAVHEDAHRGVIGGDARLRALAVLGPTGAAHVAMALLTTKASSLEWPLTLFEYTFTFTPPCAAKAPLGAAAA